MEVWDEVAMTSGELKKLMKMARRRGRWYRELKMDERTFMDLVVKVVSASPTKRIQSPVVAMLLAPIVRKLLDAVGGAIALMGEAAYRIMRSAAQKISRVAQAWGNKSARRWPEERGFIEYLLVMNLPENAPA
jgi:hypothetical protein